MSGLHSGYLSELDYKAFYLLSAGRAVRRGERAAKSNEQRAKSKTIYNFETLPLPASTTSVDITIQIFT